MFCPLIEKYLDYLELNCFTTTSILVNRNILRCNGSLKQGKFDVNWKFWSRKLTALQPT